MPVFDTSVLVALFNNSDAHRDDALRLAQEPGPVVVPGVILSEFLALVAKRTRDQHGSQVARREVRAVLESLMAQPAVRVETTYDAEAAATLFRQERMLSYPDAVGIVVAHAIGEELFTFDEKQANEYRRR